MTATGRILVAGVGNLFCSDDGFGSEVVRQLATVPLPPTVDVRDYGVGGIHLAYDASEDVQTVVLVDIEPRGEPPGTLRLVEVDTAGIAAAPLEAHRMDPVSVIGAIRLLGAKPPRMLLLACEPLHTGEGIGLTPPVAAAVAEAVAALRDLIGELADLHTGG